MPALAHGAFHIALHRQIDPVHRDTPVAQRSDCKAHHDLWAADQRDRMFRVKRNARYQCRHDPDIAAPVCRSMIDCDLDIDIKTPPPSLEFMPIEDVSRATRAVEQDYPAVALAICERAIDRGPQRSET
jgi:hypothetical protein